MYNIMYIFPYLKKHKYIYLYSLYYSNTVLKNIHQIPELIIADICFNKFSEWLTILLFCVF